MILADSSAWVEYLRQTESITDLRIDRLLAEADPPATTEVVVMELLAGAADDADRDRLRGFLYGCPLLAVGGLETYEAAAGLHRSCRAGGETVRKMTDCLIAAVAIREGAELLHADRDFDVIARHSALRIAA